MTAPHSFSSDFWEPNEVSRITAWDIDFRQISGGSGPTRIAMRVGTLLSTLKIEMPCRVHQVGVSPADVLTFGLPESHLLSDWRCTRAPVSPLVCFGAGHEFDGVSEAGFEALTISVDRANAVRLAGAFGLELQSAATLPGVIDLAAKPRAGQLLKRKSTVFANGSAQAIGMEDEEELLLALILATSGMTATADRSSKRKRDMVMRRAIDLMESEADDPPSIRDLCVRCDASWPTLNRAFIERFGVSPKSYLISLRLNRVRKELLQKDAPSVHNIANRWGFWHMGQFAKDYQKLFKRLPSEDLKSPWKHTIS